VFIHDLFSGPQLAVANVSASVSNLAIISVPMANFNYITPPLVVDTVITILVIWFVVRTLLWFLGKRYTVNNTEKVVFFCNSFSCYYGVIFPP